MFRIFRVLLGVALVAGFVWFGMSVKLGRHTLFGHVRRIWKAEETQDLVKGAKESAGPAIKRVKRGVEKGYEEAKKDP